MTTVIQASTWRRLFEGAGAMKKMAPWEWMFDTDLFAVENPHTGEIGYCCITGSTHELLGLSVYRGNTGLYSYEELQAVNVDHPLIPPAPTFEQDCLSLTFRSKDLIPQDQLAFLQSHGIHWEEDEVYPVFEDLSPGMAPWPLDKELDGQFLAIAIEQAMRVASLCKEDPDLLDHIEEGTARLLVRREAQNQHWENTWQTLDMGYPSVPNISVNKLFLRSNCMAFPQKDGRVWMADIFYFPSPLQDAENSRPYYPIMAFIADQSSGVILGYSLHKQLEDLSDLQSTLVNAIRKEGYRPERLLVSNLRALQFWEPFAQPISLKLELSQAQELFSDFKLMLFGSVSL